MVVHFEPVMSLNTIDLIERCLALKTMFGEFDLQETPYSPTHLESVGRKLPSQHFKIGSGLPELGCRLTSSEKTESIHIQNNRFSVTWTRQADGKYPRYDTLKPAFFEKLKLFTEGAGLSELNLDITQCGIQYVNQVADDTFTGFSMFNFINLRHFDQHEGLNFSTTQRLEDQHEVGRLYMEANTVFSFEANDEGQVKEKRLLQMKLTFRGAPKESVGVFLDRGHEAIVSTFSQSLSEGGRGLFKEIERV